METLSASEVNQQNFGAAIDAAQREPVFVRKQDQDIAVLMSVREYKEYSKLRSRKGDELNRIRAEIAAEAKERGLTDEILAELLSDVS